MTRYLALGALLACSGCLPGDTRPPPAEVTVTTSSSTYTLSDIPDAFTSDGWYVHIERLLVSLGRASLGDGTTSAGCNQYSNPDYTRLFDFKQVTAPRELGVAFATGRCAFGFVVRFPNESTLSDLGVAPGDAELMRLPGSDPVATDAGVSVYLEGMAERGSSIERFAWPFRKRVGYTDCTAPDDTGALRGGLDLASGEKTSVNLEVHAEALFQPPSATTFAFEPYALADANADGQIDFDELWTVPISAALLAGFAAPDTATMFVASPCWDDDGNAIAIRTLGDYAYCTLLPALVRFQGDGKCTTEIGRGPPDR